MNNSQLNPSAQKNRLVTLILAMFLGIIGICNHPLKSVHA